VEELLNELRAAKQHVSAGQMDRAKQKIEDSLEHLEDAIAGLPGPKPSVRAVRGYIAQAALALEKVDAPSVASALDSAIRVLEEPAVKRG
jgi:hypothetical protein